MRVSQTKIEGTKTSKSTGLTVPPITDFENKPFPGLISAVEKISVDGLKFQKKQRSGGSHINQYNLDILINGEKHTFFLNLQPKDGKAKTYQAQQFINILKFIQEAKANPNYFKNISNNQEALLQNFKEQLDDSDNDVESVFQSLHNLIQFIKADNQTIATKSNLDELLSKLTLLMLSNINECNKNQFKNYIYLLYRLDVINLKKKEDKNFKVLQQIVDKLKQVFKDDLQELRAKIGDEFSEEFNLVIKVESSYYVLSIDQNSNALGLSQVETSDYPVDTKFNYEGNENEIKFCSLRAVLQQKSNTVSEIRQKVSKQDISTANAKWIQISYIPLNPPKSIADASGKIIQFSNQFIYTEEGLPVELLRQCHGNNIPLDMASRAIANVYSLKSKDGSLSLKQVKVECANPQILLKKSQTKNASGEIITICFTTYELKSEKELYHFIKGEVPTAFEPYPKIRTKK